MLVLEFTTSRIYNLEARGIYRVEIYREETRRIYRGERGRAFYRRGAARSGVTHDTRVPYKFPESVSHSRIYILIYDTNLQTYSNNHVINLQVRLVCKLRTTNLQTRCKFTGSEGCKKPPGWRAGGLVNTGSVHRVHLSCKVGPLIQGSPRIFYSLMLLSGGIHLVIFYSLIRFHCGIE